MADALFNFLVICFLALFVISAYTAYKVFGKF